jgi:hypothetical protein
MNDKFIFIDLVIAISHVLKRYEYRVVQSNVRRRNTLYISEITLPLFFKGRAGDGLK